MIYLEHPQTLGLLTRIIKVAVIQKVPTIKAATLIMASIHQHVKTIS